VKTPSVFLCVLTACAPSAPPVLVDPPAPKYSGPSSLPTEKCGDDIQCWRRRTLLYVEMTELLTAENGTLGTERDDARAGEIYARNIATKLRKEAEPSWTSSPLLWLGVGVLTGGLLFLTAGVVEASLAKAVR
jgi:hypothetical protein